MDWGMLWYDDTAKRELSEKVIRAARHYEHKYGQAPTLCFVHPSAKNGTDEVQGIQIQAVPNVMPNCLWIGVGEVQPPAKRGNGKRARRVEKEE